MSASCTVCLPLAAFQGVDPRDGRAVELHFEDRPSGALLLADLAFANPPWPDVAGSIRVQHSVFLVEMQRRA